MLLLLTGALITSFLVPSFERQARRHEREFEIKSQLATRISDTISPFMAATVLNEFVADPRTSRAYDAAYQRWTTGSNAILTQMRTYFPGDNVADDWRSLETAVRWLYYIFKVREPRVVVTRAFIFKQFIRPYVVKDCQSATYCLSISWESLAKLDFLSDQIGGTTNSALRRLTVAYQLKAEAIIDAVLGKTPRT